MRPSPLVRSLCASHPLLAPDLVAVIADRGGDVHAALGEMTRQAEREMARATHSQGQKGSKEQRQFLQAAFPYVDAELVALVLEASGDVDSAIGVLTRISDEPPPDEEAEEEAEWQRVEEACRNAQADESALDLLHALFPEYSRNGLAELLTSAGGDVESLLTILEEKAAPVEEEFMTEQDLGAFRDAPPLSLTPCSPCLPQRVPCDASRSLLSPPPCPTCTGTAPPRDPQGGGWGCRKNRRAVTEWGLGVKEETRACDSVDEQLSLD